MQELEKYQKTEAYKHFTRKLQDKKKGKQHRGGETRSNADLALLSVPTLSAHTLLSTPTHAAHWLIITHAHASQWLDYTKYPLRNRS